MLPDALKDRLLNLGRSCRSVYAKGLRRRACAYFSEVVTQIQLGSSRMDSMVRILPAQPGSRSPRRSTAALTATHGWSQDRISLRPAPNPPGWPLPAALHRLKLSFVEKIKRGRCTLRNETHFAQKAMSVSCVRSHNGRIIKGPRGRGGDVRERRNEGAALNLRALNLYRPAIADMAGGGTGASL